MPLETAQFIDTLQPDWPAGTDPESDGDDHLRMVKQVLQNTFPAIKGAYTGSEGMLNDMANTYMYVTTDTTLNVDYVRFRDYEKDDGTNLPLSAMSARAKGVAPGSESGFVMTWADLMTYIFPVGHILMTSKQGNPSTWLGFGTWVQRSGYLAGAGSVTDYAGMTKVLAPGDSARDGTWRVSNNQIIAQSLPLSMDEVAPHAHTSNASSITASGGGSGSSGNDYKVVEYKGATINDGGGHTPTGNVTIGEGDEKNGAAHNSPYYGFYVWERTA